MSKYSLAFGTSPTTAFTIQHEIVLQIEALNVFAVHTTCGESYSIVSNTTLKRYLYNLW